MADQDADTGLADIEAEAAEMGWEPQDKFKGDAAKWVDAKTFVERGRVVLPILRKQNQDLHLTVKQLMQQNQQLSGAVKASQAAIEALEEARDEDVKLQVEAARRELKETVKTARKEGDVDAELDAQEQLRKLDAADADAKEREKAKKDEPDPSRGTATQTGEPSKDFLEWQEANPRFKTDRLYRAATVAMAEELALEGTLLKGKPFMDEAAKRAEEKLGIRAKPRGESKVEESRGSGGGGGGGSGKSYADLPPEAKTECDKQAKKLVGKGRRHETVDSYRKTYASIYFKE